MSELGNAYVKKDMIESGRFERLSVEKAIDLVRQCRNDLIKNLLIKDNVQYYFTERYNKPLSSIKCEFLMRDLRELLISPVDLVHYSFLITEIRKADCVVTLKNSGELFHKELELIFDKYRH